VKIANLRRIDKYPDRRLYMFNLAICGFIVNGFVYSADRGAILSPTTNHGKKKIRIVRGFGIHWKRLRQELERAVAELERLNAEPASLPATADAASG
jgi:hypothetical protein